MSAVVDSRECILRASTHWEQFAHVPVRRTSRDLPQDAEHTNMTSNLPRSEVVAGESLFLMQADVAQERRLDLNRFH